MGFLNTSLNEPSGSTRERLGSARHVSEPVFAPRLARAPAADAQANLRRPSVLGAQSHGFARGREVAALLIWTAAVFVSLSLCSYAGDPMAPGVVVRENWVGPVGSIVAETLATYIGVAAWVLPLEALLLGIPLVRGQRSAATAPRLAGDVLVVVIVSALIQVGRPTALAFGRHAAGGLLGELFGELARSLFSGVGSFLVGFALLGLILIGRAEFSFIALMRWGESLGRASAGKTASAVRFAAQAWQRARDVEREKIRQRKACDKPAIAERAEDVTILVGVSDEGTEALPEDRPIVVDRPARAKRGRAAPKPDAGVEELLGENVAVDTSSKAESNVTDAACDLRECEQQQLSELFDVDAIAATVTSDSTSEPLDEKPRKPRTRKSSGITIVDTSAALEKDAAPARDEGRKDKRSSPFVLPSLDLLASAEIAVGPLFDEAKLRANADLLIKTLADYKVTGKVEEILPGPVVTTFEVSPVAGTKVSKVAALADDLALALAKKVRIVAPIPGKTRIGFELPNDRRIPVILRDLVEDRRFQSLDCPLPVVLGRDIVGNPVYADLASMPHAIVAGATGAGKSVGLNVMLTSLLYRRSPEDLRLLMIDPKVVELAPYDRIPHMLLPVVTDMKQAATALKWAVDEMERRYQLFADAGTKNIGTYNGWVQRVLRGEARNPLGKTVIARDPNGFQEALAVLNDPDAKQEMPEPLPMIVIVVDEFADLMMQQGKEVETAVARLAQKARAAGMHVIIATQRPSVDVITGMIKANFPTRIAYRVAQKVDSRTILDEQGAEHLLGRGDMLIKLNGTNETKRVQCPWVSEEEVQLITDHLRAQGEPVYDDNILKPRDDDEAAAQDEDAEADTMYDDAVRVVAETRRCSTSWLQRKLGLGYNRAARIVETMERRGLVGPANGAKDREVLISSL